MNPREERGLALAKAAKIHRKGNDVWAVPSQSGRGRYWVRLNGKQSLCTVLQTLRISEANTISYITIQAHAPVGTLRAASG